VSEGDKTWCIVCGAQFESLGTIAEQLTPPGPQRERVRQAVEILQAERGGPRGVCSPACLWKRLVRGKPS